MMIEIICIAVFKLKPACTTKIAFAVYRLQPINLAAKLFDDLYFPNTFSHLSITPVILIKVIVI